MLASTSSAAATAAITTHTNTNASCARRRNFSSDVQHHQRKRNTNNSEFRRQRRQKRRNNGDSTLFVTRAESGGFGDGITNNGLAREISEDVDTVLLDCDGVIWHGDALVPGAKKAVDYLRETLQKRVFFVTNNATKTREYYQWKFSELGMEVDVNHIYTAAFTSASYLSAIGFNNAQCSTTTKVGSSSSNK